MARAVVSGCHAVPGLRCGLPYRAWGSRSRATPSPRLQIARGWLERPSPTCKASTGDRCSTPTGREASRIHAARLRPGRFELVGRPTNEPLRYLGLRENGQLGREPPDARFSRREAARQASGQQCPARGDLTTWVGLGAEGVGTGSRRSAPDSPSLTAARCVWIIAAGGFDGTIRSTPRTPYLGCMNGE